MSNPTETQKMNCGQVIFEILEQTNMEAVDAINYCFNDLAECNKSELKDVKMVAKMDDQSGLDKQLTATYGDSLEVATLIGMQKVAPNKRPDEAKKLI